MDDLEGLSAALTEFIGQPDSPTLLLMMSDEDTLYPVKDLASRDRQDPYTIYLAFPQSCPDAATYVDAVVEQLRLMLDAVAAHRPAEAAPSLPEQATDPREAPANRLVATIKAVGDLAPDNVVVVWALLPEAIGDLASYRELTRPLIPFGSPAPWADGHRFILRERLDAAIWAEQLHEGGVEDALVYRLEVSHAHVADALAAAVSDPSKPDDERMAAMAQLAGLDVAHRRLPEALKKYDALERYYGATERPDMRALMFGGSGDALMLASKPERALEHYRHGLVLSTTAQAHAITLTLLLCAGRACTALEDWAEAEAYFGLAIDVAAKLLNFVALADSYENRGLARAEQGQHKPAAEDWILAKKIAKRYGYVERFTSAIDHLIAIYEAASLPKEVMKLRVERQAVLVGGGSSASSDAPTLDEGRASR